MTTIYVYILDTLADWELGYVTAELNSGRFFKKDAPKIALKTVGHSKEAITTIGGMTIVPDCLIDDIIMSDTTVLLLPGADTWNDPKQEAIIEKAGELLSLGATVGAICGATVALASAGLLNDRPHTSNGPGFLDMFVPNYTGKDFYVDQPAAADNNLITASSTGGLLWAKQLIERLAVFQADTLEAWYDYFSAGKPEQFYALMQTLPSQEQ